MEKDKKTKFYVGTSGWGHKHWAGKFYPHELKGQDQFPFYIRHFNTVEINSSFHRLPTEDMVKRWGAFAQHDFLYALRAPRQMSHSLQLKNVKDELEHFYERIGPLRESLGIILFELPPVMKKDLARLEEFLALLDPEMRHALEFRHCSWVEDDNTFDLMHKYKTAFCICSSPEMPVTVAVTTTFSYVRFHGAEAYGKYNYSDRELKKWSDTLKKLRRKCRVFFIYFNNDHNAYAVHNALKFKDMLGM